MMTPVNLLFHGAVYCAFILTLGPMRADSSMLTTWLSVAFSGSSMPQPKTEVRPKVKGRRPKGSKHLVSASRNATSLAVDAEWCSEIPGLVDHQRVLCKRVPGVFAQVSIAAKLAIAECQNQFKHERWNCSTTNDSQVFAHVVTKGNRETAFIAAISSAAVVHAVARACSSGNLSECSCDASRKAGQKDVAGWRWSGCSDNVDYGMEFSRLFNDAPEGIKHREARSIRDIANLHNKAAGRIAVQRNMQLHCRCHGISGSCEVKTCWKTVGKFSTVGSDLKSRYSNAVHIAKKSLLKLKRRERSVRRKPIKSDELVFLDKSPDYCRRNRKRGIPGTTGRVCNASSTGTDSCDHLCCGRGAREKVSRKSERCHCKFVWCCEVQCKICERIYKTHRCR